MSVQATSWVWNHSKAEGNARLVLLAIADGANSQGQYSCQSVPTIAEMCKLGEATVYRKINELVTLGELSKDGKSGRYGTMIYSLPQLLNPSQNERSQNETPLNMTETPYQNGSNALSPLIANSNINPTISKDIDPIERARSSQMSKAKQAHPLPSDWMPDQATVQTIQEEHPTVNLGYEHKKFTDYWNSVRHLAKGRKTDWNATWRNWMRRVGEQQARQSGYKPGWQKRGEYYMNQMRQSEVLSWANQIEA